MREEKIAVLNSFLIETQKSIEFSKAYFVNNRNTLVLHIMLGKLGFILSFRKENAGGNSTVQSKS